MNNQYAKFKGHRCFKNEWAGFEKICPVNVIIGRNNTGKSALLDLVEALAKGDLQKSALQFCFTGTLDEDTLRGAFPEGRSGGALGYGDHWNHGRRFVGAPVTWALKGGQVTLLSELERGDYNPNAFKYIEEQIEGRLAQSKHLLEKKVPRKILAERDIQAEAAQPTLTLSFSGRGAANICRRYITGANEKYPRELIQSQMLIALNHIFGKDADFTEIQVQQHDEETGKENSDQWEIYLHEKTKGLIPLSKSGSGLKTAMLVLLNLLVVPHFQNKKASDFVFLFEELENNLHPALQRRLFAFIQDFAVKNECHVFLTTHSNVVLDVFADSGHAQILHVEHDGNSASVKTVDAYFEQLRVVNDLGAKASDLLQSNGIVWLEGPSDRVYFNKWIELYTGGNLKEGLDYQCAFYGGSILSHHSFAPSEKDRANLLRVNPNAVLIADGDRTSKTGNGSRIKPRVSEIKKEVEALPKSHVWVSDAKEVESYIPLSVLKNLFGKATLPPVDQYEPFSKEPSKSSPAKGYFQKHSPTKTFNKVEFAQQVIPLLKTAELKKIFEWDKEMERIVATIQSWNER